MFCYVCDLGFSYLHVISTGVDITIIGDANCCGVIQFLFRGMLVGVDGGKSAICTILLAIVNIVINKSRINSCGICLAEMLIGQGSR